MAQFTFTPADGRISTPFQVDLTRVNLVGGVNYTAYIMGASERGGTLNDPAVLLYNQAGQLIGGQDTSSVPIVFGKDPFYQFNAPATGTYYIGVTDLHGSTGTYTQHISVSGPPVSF